MIAIGHDSPGAASVALSSGTLLVASGRGGTRVVPSLANKVGFVVAFAVLDR